MHSVAFPISIEGMRRVNALRNQCAHVHAHRIALEDIDRVGETIQPTYEELKAAYKYRSEALTVWTLSKLYEPFLAATLTAELGNESHVGRPFIEDTA